MTDEERLHKGSRAREVTAERLRELLHYDPETGAFTWRVARSFMIPAGAPAGSNGHKSGYVHLKIDDRMYKAHRLAFLYMTGSFPDGDVDHADLNKSNNAWGNLRCASRSENNRNVGARRSNKLGVKGVCWHKPSNRFIAQARFLGKQHYLGVYKTVDEAAAAYRDFMVKNHGEFAREHG